MTSMYEVPKIVWWLIFGWGALGWLATLSVSILSARLCSDLESGLKFWHDRSMAPRATILPPPPPRSELDLGDTGTSWRDSRLHTQVHHARREAPTRSYTPAQVRAAHIHSRK